MAVILRYFTEFGSFHRAHCVKVVEYVVIKKFTFAISSTDEFLLCIFPNADPVSVVSSSSGSGRSQATKYIS